MCVCMCVCRAFFGGGVTRADGRGKWASNGGEGVGCHFFFSRRVDGEDFPEDHRRRGWYSFQEAVFAWLVKSPWTNVELVYVEEKNKNRRNLSRRNRT